MGLRAGLSVGLVLFFTIVATFLVMYLMGGILLERISLGAFIIALCMLTDNAIVITEGIKVGIEARQGQARRHPRRGRAEPVAAVRRHGHRRRRLRRDRPLGGQHRRVHQLAVLGHLHLADAELGGVGHGDAAARLRALQAQGRRRRRAGDAYRGAFFQGYRRLLVAALRFRWAVLASALGAASSPRSTASARCRRTSSRRRRGRSSWSTPSCRPARTSATRRRSPSQVEQFILAQPGVTHVTSFVGGGGLRFLLVYSPERGEPRLRAVPGRGRRRAEDRRPAGRRCSSTSTQNYPNANAVAKKFLLGPGKGGRVQARFSGPDPAMLRALADQAERILVADGGAVGIRDDWREPEKVIQPDLREVQARRNGITRVEVAQALETGFEGRVVGFYPRAGRRRRRASSRRRRACCRSSPGRPRASAAASTRSTACRSGARWRGA